MKWYKHSIGDYFAGTRGLTLAEHGAYRLLMDLYYEREGPISADERDLFRAVGATSRLERAAVRSVVTRFFSVKNRSLVHASCDRRLGEVKPQLEASRNNGQKGGRPKKNQVDNKTQAVTQAVTQEEPRRNLDHNLDGTKAETTRARYKNQEPEGGFPSRGKPPDLVEPSTAARDRPRGASRSNGQAPKTEPRPQRETEGMSLEQEAEQKRIGARRSLEAWVVMEKPIPDSIRRPLEHQAGETFDDVLRRMGALPPVPDREPGSDDDLGETSQTT